MSLEEKVKEEKLQTLTDMWISAKNNENNFKEARLKVEDEITTFLKDKLKKKGTYTALTNLQITTGEEEKWNDKEIAKLKHKFDDGELEGINDFPFDIKYTPNNPKLKILKEANEKLFFQALGVALTTKEKKASFKMKT